MKKYLIALLTEKGIIQDIADYPKLMLDAGIIGITHETFLDFICENPPIIQNDIKRKFVFIDFNNGDVNHFYTYLMKKYIELIRQNFSAFV